MSDEALLPCFCYRHLEPFREHHETCPAYYRSVVVAALRKRDEDCREVQEDHQRLVRELDKIWNGENAAKQASLCDLEAQLAKEVPALRAKVERFESGADRRTLLAERYGARSACDVLQGENAKLRAKVEEQAKIIEAERAEIKRATEAWDVIGSFVQFRRDLRQLLFDYGVLSNPGFTENCIVDALRRSLAAAQQENRAQAKALEETQAMNWRLWQALTPEKRHELNLDAPMFPAEEKEGG